MVEVIPASFEKKTIVVLSVEEGILESEVMSCYGVGEPYGNILLKSIALLVCKWTPNIYTFEVVYLLFIYFRHFHYDYFSSSIHEGFLTFLTADSACIPNL